MSEAMDIPQTIAQLHAAYVELTGFTLPLHAHREFAWLEFIRRDFTVEDLRMVIKHVQGGIRQQTRRPAALLFRNLVLNLDGFEEDLHEARARGRVRQVDANRAATLRATGRDPQPIDYKTQNAGEAAKAAVDKLRKFKEGLQ